MYGAQFISKFFVCALKRKQLSFWNYKFSKFKYFPNKITLLLSAVNIKGNKVFLRAVQISALCSIFFLPLPLVFSLFWIIITSRDCASAFGCEGNYISAEFVIFYSTRFDIRRCADRISSHELICFEFFNEKCWRDEGWLPIGVWNVGLFDLRMWIYLEIWLLIAILTKFSSTKRYQKYIVFELYGDRGSVAVPIRRLVASRRGRAQRKPSQMRLRVFFSDVDIIRITILTSVGVKTRLFEQIRDFPFLKPDKTGIVLRILETRHFYQNFCFEEFSSS